VETYETNVIGTLNVFEACRYTGGVKAIVNITSDKCYENKEWIWGYRENDPMGGYDPYSSSKGCAELLAASYRNSYFNNADYGTKHNTLMASCRAGNVIGGGDWAMDRLITDIMVAASKDETVSIRSPKATRPWQHVLEPLSGYLLVGKKLLEGDVSCAEGWNFGPGEEGSITVEQVCEYISRHWDKIRYAIHPDASLHEAHLLKLDCSKAHAKLKWHSVWNSEETFIRTVEWYKTYYEQGKCITNEQLSDFTKLLTY
jgi:CDP-glucose 4,6-dehydratase